MADSDKTKTDSSSEPEKRSAKQSALGTSRFAFLGKPESGFASNVAGNILNEIKYNSEKVEQMASIRSTDTNIKARDVMNKLDTQVRNVIYEKKAPAIQPSTEEKTAETQPTSSPSFRS